METSDVIALISLGVAVIGIPVGYCLGGRNNRNNAYNQAINELETLCSKVLETVLNIHKDGNRCESDYHLMIAYHKQLQAKCQQIQHLGGDKLFPRLELREVKKITTDQLFDEDEQQQRLAIRNLIYKLTPLQEFYRKKFH